jgi:carbon monoxide dehydrogenase subunit G
MQIEVSRAIEAPADVVWQIITDLPNRPHVIQAIKSVDILDGGDELAVGTRWRETRTMFGREASEEMTVSAVDPGRSYSTTAHSNGNDYLTTLTVVPSGAGCTLTMRFGATSTSTVSRLMSATIGRLFVGATRKAVAGDLEDIAAAAEGVALGDHRGDESGGRPAGP